MIAKHSKAPWRPGLKDGEFEQVVAEGVVIAHVIPTDCTEEEFIANCALIYAAPDLLSCLEEAVLDSEEKLAEVKEGMKHGFYTQSDYDQKEREINHAKAVVARAKGGAP